MNDADSGSKRPSTSRGVLCSRTTTSSRCVAALVVAVVVAACAAADDGPDPERTWVGTVTTEGDVTTVVNESGSVWGGTARLVEELAIGVEAGADEYMFGYINSMYANDERIVVADEQADIVRAYDRSGEFLFDVGGQGQGPGEYVDPMILTMDAAGRVSVYDIRSRRLSQFGPSGDFIASLQLGEFGCCAWNMHPRPEGLLWIPIMEFDRETRESRYGARLYSMEGPAGEPLWVPEIDFEPTTFDVDDRQPTTPFSPSLVWYPTPDGGMVAGANDRYRFEILRPDGSRTVVHHYAEPAPVDDEEWEWNRRMTVARWRRNQEGFNWDGAEMPHRRAAYAWFSPAHSGEIWVVREIGSTRVADCTEDPLAEYAGELSIERCFLPVYVLDVFGSDGRYLGEVEIPSDMRPFGLYVDGTTVIGGFNEDELGVVRVKQYRLVVPGRE